MSRYTFVLAAIVSLAGLASGGCRSCSSCHDYDPPVANCNCGACPTSCGCSGCGCSGGGCSGGGCSSCGNGGGCASGQCGCSSSGQSYSGPTPSTSTNNTVGYLPKSMVAQQPRSNQMMNR